MKRKATTKKRRQRRLHMERLETRDLLAGDMMSPITNVVQSVVETEDAYVFVEPPTTSAAGPQGEGVSLEIASWRNPIRTFDVDGDGFISPIDALLIINLLNDKGSHILPATVSIDEPQHFVDPSGDGSVSPLDVLQVSNFLNNRRTIDYFELVFSGGRIDDFSSQAIVWTSAEGNTPTAAAITYDVSVSLTPDCQTIDTFQYGVEELEISFFDMLPNGEYFVCVTARNEMGITLPASNQGVAFEVRVPELIGSNEQIASGRRRNLKSPTSLSITLDFGADLSVSPFAPVFDNLLATPDDVGSTFTISSGPVFDLAASVLTNGIDDSVTFRWLIGGGGGGLVTMENRFFFDGSSGGPDFQGNDITDISLVLDSLTIDPPVDRDGGIFTTYNMSLTIQVFGVPS
jgi:Dockerin type I domain